MLTFAMIGLVCNSLGCYWATMDERRSFNDQQECASAAAEIRKKSVMYFDASCLVQWQVGGRDGSH